MRQLKHRLADEARRVVERIALLDLAHAHPETLAALGDELGRIADRLDEEPALPNGLALAEGEDMFLHERSGISGRSNALAAPLDIEVGTEITTATAVWGAAYEGPPGCLHGGFVAAAFDDLLGLAQMASGEAGFTGTLTVKMRAPTPLFRRIDYKAWVEHASGRKIVCKGTARDGDTLLAEAECLFVKPKSGVLTPPV